MKFNITFLVAVFLIFNLLPDSVIAQVEIGPDDIPTEPGSIYPFYVATDPEGIEVDLGFGGEDRNWDFSMFDFDGIAYDSLIALEDTPYAEEYEDANRVVQSTSGAIAINLGDSYQYEIVNDDGWFLLGMGFEGGGFGFPIIFPEPLELLPMPAEFDQEWDMIGSFAMGMEAPDTLLGGILDSVYIVIEIGGRAETDAWGTVTYPSGEVETMRQHVLMGVEVLVIGVRTIFGQRIEIPIDLGLDIELTHTYRWFAEDLGLLVEITSLPGEEEENFELAASIRVRYIAPELVFSEEPLEFGEVWPDSVNSQAYNFRNNGVGDGRIMRIETPEEFEGQISWDVELPYTVNPNEEGVINFIWQPIVLGDLETEIEIFHNDPEVENPTLITIRCNSHVGVTDEDYLKPQQLSLYQNFPNPFNSSTKINYGLSYPGHVSINVYNIYGVQINTLYNGYKSEGVHSEIFTANNLPSGIYFIRMNTMGQVMTQKIMLIR